MTDALPLADQQETDSRPAIRAWDAFTKRCPRGPAMLILVVLVFSLNGITAHQVSQVSEIDEIGWIDHLVRGSQFEITQTGDGATLEATREACLRGGVRVPSERPPCDAWYLAPQHVGFWEGVNLSGHTPFYFLIDGPIAGALRATPIDLSPNDSLVGWARLLGSVWLLVGWYLVLRAGDLLRVNRRMLVTALVLISATPALLHASTIVNPDQTAVPSGAALLLALLAWEKRGKGLIWIALAALTIAALDPTNTVAIIAALIYLTLRVVARYLSKETESTRPWADYVKVGAVLIVAVVLANRGWDWLAGNFLYHPISTGVDLTRDPGAIEATSQASNLTFWDALNAQFEGTLNVFSLFPPFRDIAPPIQRMNLEYGLVSELAVMFAVGAMVASVLRDQIKDRLGAIGFTTAISLIVCPTIFVFYFYSLGTFTIIPGRFGLPMLPFLAIVIATAARTRFAKWLLVFLAAGLYLSAIYVVL